jgi:uncharacterized protein (TIGR03435 family)
MFLIVFACIAAHGQTAPVFEAASIKPATPLGPHGMRFVQTGGPGTSDPGRFTCQNCTLYQVVLTAYATQPFKFSGPDWLQDRRFDISAKVPDGATKEAFREMLQNLLSERFKLAVHREQRAAAVYELTLAKSGHKLKEPESGEPPPKLSPQSDILQKDAEGYPILPPGMVMAISDAHARIRSINQPMVWLVGMLENQLGSGVTDATGLKGKYDFVLSWVFDQPGVSATTASDPSGPTLPDALQSQLGLKLERKKGTIEMLVVDHIEKAPTEN